MTKVNFGEVRKDTSEPSTSSGILEPSKKDVILGRGGVVNRHKGNKRFRKYASEMKDVYKHGKITRDEKYAMSRVRT